MPRCDRQRSQSPLDLARRDAASARADEQCALVHRGIAARSASHVLSAPPRGRADRHDPLLRALAPHAHFAGREVDAVDIESGQLGQPQPRRIRELEQRVIALAPAASSPALSTSRTASSGVNADGQLLRGFRRLQSDARDRRCMRTAAVGEEAMERAPRGEHARKTSAREAAAVEHGQERARAARVRSVSGVVACERRQAARGRADRRRACARAGWRGASRTRPEVRVVGFGVGRGRSLRHRAERRPCAWELYVGGRNRAVATLASSARRVWYNVPMPAWNRCAIRAAERQQAERLRRAQRHECERLQHRRRPRTTRAIRSLRPARNTAGPAGRRTGGSPWTSPRVQADTIARAPCPTAARRPEARRSLPSGCGRARRAWSRGRARRRAPVSSDAASRRSGRSRSRRRRVRGTCASSSLFFSRSVTICRSAIGIAWPPCGCGTKISAMTSAYSSKNFGFFFRYSRDFAASMRRHLRSFTASQCWFRRSLVRGRASSARSTPLEHARPPARSSCTGASIARPCDAELAATHAAPALANRGGRACMPATTAARTRRFRTRAFRPHRAPTRAGEW